MLGKPGVKGLPKIIFPLDWIDVRPVKYVYASVEGRGGRRLGRGGVKRRKVRFLKKITYVFFQLYLLVFGRLFFLQFCDRTYTSVIIFIFRSDDQLKRRLIKESKSCVLEKDSVMDYKNLSYKQTEYISYTRIQDNYNNQCYRWTVMEYNYYHRIQT